MFDILHAAGVNAVAASTNDPGVRIDMVAGSLTRLVDGRPAYLISEPGCPLLVSAKKGGYHYDKKETPEKNEYSHVSDAEQYMFDGAGEARRIVTNGRQLRPSKAKANFSVFKSRPFQNRLHRSGGVL